MGRVTFPSGKSTIYTGQTSRSVYERAGEHLRYQKNGDRQHYTGRGVKFEVLGSVFSNNRFKAEKTIKGLSREEKERLARQGARNYKKKRFGFW